MNTQPHPFTLRQLQYVLAVAEHLSFRKAAEACHVSQPSLSAQVAQVEETLGVVLFERDRRRVLLTPAGALLMDRIRRLVVDAHALAERARRAADPLASTLRLGVIPTLAPYLLPPLTITLRERLPALVALWTEEKTPDLVAALKAGRLDAVLLALEADLQDLEHAVLGVDPFVLAVPPGHPLAIGRGPVSVDVLQPYAVLLLDEGHCFRTQALEFCARSRVSELAYRATSLGTLAQMVAGGAGITLLPRMAVPTESERAGLVVRPLAEPVPFRTVALAWRPGSPLATAFERLAEVIRSGQALGLDG